MRSAGFMARVTFALALASIPIHAFASPKTIIVPYSVTFTTDGFVEPGAVDGQDFFGGGDLSGLPFVDTLTMIFHSPWSYYKGQFYNALGIGKGAETLTVNGHSYTMTGGSFMDNTFSKADNYDERDAATFADGGNYYILRDLNSIKRSPSQWESDQTLTNIFSNNTVYGSGSGSFDALPVSGNRTYLGMEDLSITSSYTTIAITLPEPEEWTVMLIGFGAIGLAMRTRVRRQKRSAQDYGQA